MAADGVACLICSWGWEKGLSGSTGKGSDCIVTDVGADMPVSDLLVGQVQ